MNTVIESILNGFFDTHNTEILLDELAMENLKDAINKAISDGYVRKELYKEKLAELDEMSVALSTALEALSTAENEAKQYMQNYLQAQEKLDELVRNEEQMAILAKKDALVRAALLEDGVNPRFLSLLMREIDFDTIVIELENDTECIVGWPEILASLKVSFPEAFEEEEERVRRISLPPVRGTTYPNPWNKDSLSLEAQMRLYRENPTLARQLAASVGIRLN